MNEIDLNRIKLLYDIIDEVKVLKEKDFSETIIFDLDIFNYYDDFEKHNVDIFKTNIYVIYRLYKKEFDEFKKSHNKIGINEYFDFIESLNLPPMIYKMYMKMPEMLEDRKILSYITDIPSFMSIKKDY